MSFETHALSVGWHMQLYLKLKIHFLGKRPQFTAYSLMRRLRRAGVPASIGR